MTFYPYGINEKSEKMDGYVLNIPGWPRMISSWRFSSFFPDPLSGTLKAKNSPSQEVGPTRMRGSWSTPAASDRCGWIIADFPMR